MTERESLYHKFPDYRVDLEPSDRRVRVSAAGEVVADSTRTLIVRETKHDPVFYFPRDDVRFELLERTQHGSFCPFKGEASYWSVRIGGETLRDAVWSYEDPFEQVGGLKDYVAFYPDRFETEVA